MFVIKHRNWFFALSGLLVAGAIAAIVFYGFNFSVDFKGGTLTEIRYEGERLAKEDIESRVSSNNFGGFSVRPIEETGYVVRTRELSDEEKAQLESSLAVSGVTSTIERQTTVGPVAGAELQRKALIAVAVVMLMILLFVTFAFRKVSHPVSSWKYGLATIVALVHDVLIPVGAFVVLGHYLGLEIDLLFVSGLLAILGYSVHDTIVVFDRVRENLRVNEEKKNKEDFETLVGRSLMQTLARSINTSFTVLIVILVLYFVGSTATKDFSLLLLIGIFAGTYSSIFLASPLLVAFNKIQKK